jgi:putative colanic acid biosynthesis acetyltransferase WcaF
MALDIAANRRAKKYSSRELAARILWQFVKPFFRVSPRPFFAWRNWLLRRLGAKVGRNTRIENSVRIQYPWMLEVGDYSAVGERVLIYNLGKVTIGTRVTISQQAHLCAGSHDYTRAEMPLERLPITVGDEAWICTDAFIGPNVSVGSGAVVGARAAVFEDVQPWTVVGGNPARFIKERVLGCPPNDERPRGVCDK